MSKKEIIMYSKFILVLTFIGIIHLNNLSIAQNIPLPEHPRPDFEREQWINLNGVWQFEFDSLDIGIEKDWNSGDTEFSKKITVPFPWGSNLSGIENKADIGWYKRELKVQEEWKNKRTFITIGASDWETTVWLDGDLLGSHHGGYVPFSFELTGFLKYGEQQKLVIRVDDKRRVHTLYGKQGYGNARGIWQTVYLEARGNGYIEAIHFTPDIDKKQVEVTAYLPEPVNDEKKLHVEIKGASVPLSNTIIFKKGQSNN